jgi:transposase
MRSIVVWPAPGPEDIELGVFMGPKVVIERRRFIREFKLEAVRLIRGSLALVRAGSQDLKVRPRQLRNRVKAFADDPRHAFPGQGQLKPEQLESGSNEVTP